MKMQKIFAVVLAVMLFLLPCFALAEESKAEIGGADAPANILVNEKAESATEEPVVEETAEEEMTEETTKLEIGFYPDRFVDSLQYMLKGLVGIFVVTGMIILVLFVMDKIGNRKKNNEE